ncbi:MAG TPA: Holliday junction resolvase RuvX [Pyrinomonadaceae bacterium]|nr:Holliday junction resolvase RuvX [Pyrinomonadaceae bacterium]
MQEKETFNPAEFTDLSRAPEKGRIVALDPGTKKVGVAVCDELQIAIRPVCVIERKGWKKFLKQTIELLADLDAAALVIGLPYNFDGSESEMSQEARRLARNFSLSLDIPVFLQDERLSSYEAKGLLWKHGFSEKEVRKRVDSEAAVIILSDFLLRKGEEEKRRRGERN